MQVIHKNEAEGVVSGETDSMDPLLCIGRISRYLETGEVEYELAGKFLLEIKKEFGGGDEELVKVAELKRIEQRGRNMEEFVQDFKRVVRGSGYEGCLLLKEFKRGMNGVIRRRLMEAET